MSFLNSNRSQSQANQSTATSTTSTNVNVAPTGGGIGLGQTSVGGNLSVLNQTSDQGAIAGGVSLGTAAISANSDIAGRAIDTSSEIARALSQKVIDFAQASNSTLASNVATTENVLASTASVQFSQQEIVKYALIGVAVVAIAFALISRG